MVKTLELNSPRDENRAAQVQSCSRHDGRNEEEFMLQVLASESLWESLSSRYKCSPTEQLCIEKQLEVEQPAEPASAKHMDSLIKYLSGHREQKRQRMRTVLIFASSSTRARLLSPLFHSHPHPHPHPGLGLGLHLALCRCFVVVVVVVLVLPP